jgi:GDPmannose 4,6-dehydratase
MSRRASVRGGLGLDGDYLLHKGYAVCGTSCDGQVSFFGGLHEHGVGGNVRLESMAQTDFPSVLKLVRTSVGAPR